MFTEYGGMRSCTIYSTSLVNMTMTGESITSGAIANGTENVILYCICTVDNDVAVGPTTWFEGNPMVDTSNEESDNPYTRDNVPSPLIFTSFTRSDVGVYGCRSNTMESIATISLTISGMYTL